MNYYLDTNICIYFLKGAFQVLSENIFLKKPSDIKIPSIVKAELLYGAEKSNKRAENLEKIQLFLLPFEIVPFDDIASRNYSVLRSSLEKTGNVIGPNDMIIAATVLSRGGILITNNEKEFNRIGDLVIENWTKNND